MNPTELVKTIIEEQRTIQANLINLSFVLTEIADQIEAAFQRGNKLLLCGNGGSAADAQHVAAEFIGRFQRERIACPAIALNTNASSLTAIGNDYDFEYVFARQVEAFAKSGDVFVGISTSGNSVNVLKAISTANARGCVTIGFTGESGGKMQQWTNFCLQVPSSNTARIQEAHILCWHIICELVERQLPTHHQIPSTLDLAYSEQVMVESNPLQTAKN